MIIQVFAQISMEVLALGRTVDLVAGGTPQGIARTTRVAFRIVHSLVAVFASLTDLLFTYRALCGIAGAAGMIVQVFAEIEMEVLALGRTKDLVAGETLAGIARTTRVASRIVHSLVAVLASLTDLLLHTRHGAELLEQQAWRFRSAPRSRCKAAHCAVQYLAPHAPHRAELPVQQRWLRESLGRRWRA
jgi:hypothetical protein